MATIKAIEARTVHQIQSGQVIVDLCSVVKELVENSVDAGATSIEVRFKNQGLDSVEVQDNGAGVSPQNYETLALKHYTSKLSTYEDLTSLQTFGFRGEALSSLCALSKFSVITCLAADAPKGSKLDFETSGKLKGTSVIAAQRGTTVTVEGLFSNLPVRRRELERNIKREWNKVIGLLNQYACILTGVKFSVSQQPNKGKKIMLFSTKGNSTTRENIVNVFGAKTLTVLIALELDLELEPTTTALQRGNSRYDGVTKEIKIKGHVSRPAHGEGRQTPDRQMFFVNGRPCGLPQFAKVFNEVYKSYNSSQSPFIFADIRLDTDMYDVNVSPDKRTILLHDQSRLLDNLRESLTGLFEAQEYSVPLAQLGGSKQTPFRKLTMSRQSTLGSDSGKTATSSTHNEEIQSRSEEEPDDDEDNDGSSNVHQKEILQAGLASGLMSRWIKKTSDNQREADKNPSLSNSDETEVSRRMERPISQHHLQDRIPGSSSPEPEEAEDHDTRSREPLLAATSATEEPDMHDIEPEEPPIPSIAAPSRVSEVKTVVISPPKPRRRAPEIATITIGNETVTSVLGLPAKKRLRTEDMSGSTSSKSSGARRKAAPLPSFNGRLTQMFAASSTARDQPDESDVSVELSDNSDRSRSPSEESEGLFVEDEGPPDAMSGHDSDNASSEVRIRKDAASHSSSERDSVEPMQREIEAADHSEEDADYMDEVETKAQEESRVQDMINAAEDTAKASSEETQKREQSFIKGSTKGKGATYQILQKLRLSPTRLKSTIASLEDALTNSSVRATSDFPGEGLDAANPEEKLSLTISKSDFGKMRIVGQFNLGFIIAVRAADADNSAADDQHAMDDEVFIIDQHATDEKYNFERLQATTVVQSQRLVHPKVLELTAIEEEVIKENMEALEHNGFQVSIDESGYQPVGSRCQLLSLPLSRETTFSLADLEELVSLLTDHQSVSTNTIPRPSKVRKMFAMRACRSSVMIGRSLSIKQMEKLVRHMGELDKPWNCPHGRPTMRHLSGLGVWNESSWREGDGFGEERADATDWSAYMAEKRER